MGQRYRSLNLPELENQLGTAAALQLAADYGGLVVHIPMVGSTSKRAAELRAYLGTTAAHALMSHYGGERLYIPQDTETTIRHRDAWIYDQRRQGTTVASIVRQLPPAVRVSERRIYDIVRMQREAAARAKPQTRLF